MAHEIRVPRLGWSMEEGAFRGWRKRDGDAVRIGDVLYELEGEKAAQEIESVDAGILRIPAGSPAEGAAVKVGALIGFLAAEGEATPALGAGDETNPTDAAPEHAAAAPAAAVRLSGRRAATPRAKRAAAELGIDWKTLSGTGLGGRVRERDVRAPAARVTSPDAATRFVPITRLRRTIADRMLRSARETAPVTLSSRIEAAGLAGLRNRLKSASGGAPVPSYTDIVAKLAAMTLHAHPLLAGVWCGDRIEFPDDAGFHIGIAVDAPDGLVVPVIRDAARRSLDEVAAASRELIDRARQGRLQARDLEGGVFTVTNLGAFGIDAFTPIVNLPETAVLGIGALRREPACLADGRIAAREFVTLSLTFDHRVVDGAPAARFLQALARAIANADTGLGAGAANSA